MNILRRFLSAIADIYGRFFLSTKKDHGKDEVFSRSKEEEVLPKDKSRWNYFTEEEIKGLDYEFIALLDQARELAKVPFVITSGYRDWKKNMEVGGVADSSHLAGVAVDLACSDSVTRHKIVKALLDVGICRIFLYTKHLHCDNDFTKPQNVLGLGEKK